MIYAKFLDVFDEVYILAVDFPDQYLSECRRLLNYSGNFPNYVLNPSAPPSKARLALAGLDHRLFLGSDPLFRTLRGIMAAADPSYLEDAEDWHTFTWVYDYVESTGVVAMDDFVRVLELGSGDCPSGSELESYIPETYLSHFGDLSFEIVICGPGSSPSNRHSNGVFLNIPEP
jgi:hypothetical protein